MSVLRRFKMATLLNVLGLSVAFSAFILIMMQVEYDQNFDRGYTDTESIFRVEAMFEDGGQAVICRPLADADVYKRQGRRRGFGDYRYRGGSRR